MMLQYRRWKWVFLLLPLFYMVCYAPWGINESDGGFITGLAWQVLSGKTLYQDITYVRPPMSIWLRVLELRIFPENWAILAERCMFYAKVALYTYCAAAILIKNEQKWALAAIGYVVSVHCYPAAAWHTVDGILCGVLGFWFLGEALRANKKTGFVMAGACCIIAASLCKQSFYPLLVLWPIVLGYLFSVRKFLIGITGLIGAAAAFFGYLYKQGVLSNYLNLTGGASESGQAIQHGIFDYFDINLLLILPFACVLALLYVVQKDWFAKTWSPDYKALILSALGIVFLLLLPLSYGLVTWKNQAFTLPFAQSRLLFDGAVLWGAWAWYRGHWSLEQTLRFAALLGVSWCAGLSCGYSLPILCAVPWVYAWMDVATVFGQKFVLPLRWRGAWLSWLQPVYFALLLGVFGFAYTFLYNDGKRSDAQVHLGTIFPKLQGIYTSAEHADLYRDLQQLATQFGPGFKTLPHFTLANYLTSTFPVLPLDWVVLRESGSDNSLIDSTLNKKNFLFFVQKAQIQRIQIDPEMKFAQKVLEKGNIIAETPHFLVVRTSHE